MRSLCVHKHVNVVQSHKEFFYLIQNSQAVKKECGLQKAMVKKDVKSKVVAKKWL